MTDLRKDRVQPAWLPPFGMLFRGLAKYFRYEVSGLENVLEGASALLVAYHGRPLAWDVIFLAHRLRALTGQFPAVFTHRGFLRCSVMKQLGDSWGAIYAEPTEEEVGVAKRNRQHYAVLPGGTQESLRPAWRRNRVEFGGHRGYLRFALKHDLPIVPIVATGIEEVYFGLNDGHKWSKKLGVDTSVPLWFGVGMGGLYPFALPWPVKIRQVIGRRLELTSLKRRYSDPQALLESANALVTSTLQSMLDDARREMSR